MAQVIAAATGVSDLSALTSAFGAAYSASGGDLDASADAVIASAKLSSADPEGIRPKAAAASDLKRETGVDDVEKNLSLLMTAGAVTRPEDPQLFAKSFPHAVSQTVAMMPEQNSETLAVQAGALNATLTQFGGDITGEETKTARISFAKSLDGLFDDLPAVVAEPKEKLDKLEASNTLSPTQVVNVKQLQEKRSAVTPNVKIELASLVKRNEDDPNALNDNEKSRLAKLRKQEFTETDRAKIQQLNERSTYSKLESQERTRLQGFVESASGIKDPKDCAKRIEFVQQNEDLHRELFKTDIGGEVARLENLTGACALTELQSAPLPLIDRREVLMAQNRESDGDAEIEAKIKALDLLIDSVTQAGSDRVDQLLAGMNPPRAPVVVFRELKWPISRAERTLLFAITTEVPERFGRTTVARGAWSQCLIGSPMFGIGRHQYISIDTCRQHIRNHVSSPSVNRSFQFIAA